MTATSYDVIIIDGVCIGAGMPIGICTLDRLLDWLLDGLLDELDEMHETHLHFDWPLPLGCKRNADQN